MAPQDRGTREEVALIPTLYAPRTLNSLFLQLVSLSGVGVSRVEGSLMLRTPWLPAGAGGPEVGRGVMGEYHGAGCVPGK